jgi:very-short-patch-repair endonuclease
MAAGAIKVTLPPQAFDVNAGWLEKQFSDPAERRNLLNWLGLAASASNDTEDEGVLALETVELPAVVERLGAYLNQAGEARLSPTALATSLTRSIKRPGLVNVLTLFFAPVTQYSKRTLSDLSRLTHWTDEQFSRTALSAIFAPAKPGCSAPAPALSPLPLNEAQLAAVRAGLNSCLTVITGPPGTGKSQVVSAIMVAAALTGRSALLASKNHKALDAVEERLAALLDGRALLARANLRYGSGQGFDLRRAADALFARCSTSGARETLERAVERLQNDDERLDAIESQLRQQTDLAERIATVEWTIEREGARLTPDQTAWARRHLDTVLPAPGHGYRGGPVCQWLFGMVGHWLEQRHRRQFLAALAPLEIPWSSADDGLRQDNYMGLVRYRDALAALEALKLDLLRPAEIEDLTDRLVLGRSEITARAAELLRRLPAALEVIEGHERAALAELMGSMAVFGSRKLGQAGALTRHRALAQAFPMLRRHFPLWAVTNLSAGRILPLEPALFDLVIIDEASQCDIASAVPLLFRAKQAVIVGDPAQLRHVTKCTPEREFRLLETHGLVQTAIGRYSYRSQSLFHLGASTPGVSTHLLRDHYRCAPRVADYVNDAFYGGRLRIVTDEAQLRPPPGQKPGIHWTDVREPVQAASSGCHAPGEVEAIVAYLREILVEQHYQGTIGVITPFREQAKRLTDRISTAIPTERIAESQLGAMTAHQFQGDARDLILFSLCLGPTMPLGSRHFLAEGAHLINVAVSRARAVCHVFGNREEARLSGMPHLMKLALTSAQSVDPTQGPLPFESPWEETLYQALRARGLHPIPQYPVIGRRLDLALISGRIRLDIEVDGDRYHRNASGRRNSADLWRDHQIKSLGWRVKRYWVYQLRENLDGCVNDILAAVEH